MFIADDWQDYEVLDTGHGEKLERWRDIILRRPDPQVIWPPTLNEQRWNQCAAHYHRSSSGGGCWQFNSKLPERWTISYGKSCRFYIRPTNFKHTGLFPEQAVNWRWIMEKIAGANRPISVLNLFAYTGGATVAAAAAGADVCHVDAAKGMVQWAKENIQLSGLEHRTVRFITDDVFKFVAREQRRGRKYDAIIMDPPSFGRGPGGETWKLEASLYDFTASCLHVLSDNPLFFLINSYTTGLSASVLKNIMTMTIGKNRGGKVVADEIGLPVTASGLVLPAGASARWEA
ncbi:MAG TPA: class I SAM-dependent methyltransferase [Bacilli bacterium]